MARCDSHERELTRRNSDGCDRREQFKKRGSLGSIAKFWETNSLDDVHNDTRLDSSVQDHEYDYTHAIRGKTKGVLSLYKNMDDDRGTLKRSLSDFADRLVGARSYDCSSVGSFGSDTSLEMDQVFEGSMRSLDEAAYNSLRSLEDIVASASCDTRNPYFDSLSVKSPNEESNSPEITAYSPTNETEHGNCSDCKSVTGGNDSHYDSTSLNLRQEVSSSQLKYLYESDSDDSYDDRSNNGHFEFPPKSRKRAELKRAASKQRDSCDICTPTGIEAIRDSAKSVRVNDYYERRVSAPASIGIGSDLLLDWPPSKDSTRRYASNELFKTESHNDSCRSDQSMSYKELIAASYQDETSQARSCPPHIASASESKNHKCDVLPAKSPEQQLMRSSTSSLYDLHPNLSSSTSPTFTWLKGASKLQSPELEPKLSSSSSTYASQQTSLESPNVRSSLIASSLLVEWGDTAESDDEDR